MTRTIIALVLLAGTANAQQQPVPLPPPKPPVTICYVVPGWSPQQPLVALTGPMAIQSQMFRWTGAIPYECLPAPKQGQ